VILHKEDLRALVKTDLTLNKYIDERGFPPGRIIAGRRTWTEREVLAWVEAQPTDKMTKGVTGRAKPGECRFAGKAE
jgi:hypothetical protein